MEKKNEWCQEVPWWSEAWVRLASPYKPHDQIIGEIVAEAERRKEREVLEWVKSKAGIPEVEHCECMACHYTKFIAVINSRLASLGEGK